MPTPKVTVSKSLVRGERMWQVYRRESGKRRRSFFPSKDAADSEALRIRDEFEKAGKAWVDLSPAERNELIAVWGEVSKAGFTLRKVWEEYRRAPRIESPALADAITELVAVKRNSGRAKSYTVGLDAVLSQFANGHAAALVSKIGLPEVEKFLDSKNIQSRSTLRSRLSTLFKFCVRRGYRLDNPCAQLESVTIDRKPPEVFTPEQMRTCLKWFRRHREAFPWFILTALCGLRPEEADHVERGHIHAKEGWVRVEVSKIRQRRVVYPKPEVMKLLSRSLRGATLPLSKASRRRAIRKLRLHLKWKAWPKDITRHTAASYWLADNGSAEHIAEMLGHSEGTLKKHYKAIVTREQAKAFWATLKPWPRK